MLFERTFRRTKVEEDQSWKLPATTMSICPECNKVIKAKLYEEDGKVWMFKSCPEHGSYTELICSDVEFFLKRRRVHFELPSGVENPLVESTGNCPNDCGLCSNHLSVPCLVNIDLTNRCNLMCPICFANANVAGRVFDLTMEQLEKMLDIVANIKPHPPLSIQFAGGEPTVHPDFLKAVKMAKDKGFLEIQVASNGLKFAQDPEFAYKAAEAGLDVVYLQFDGIDDEIYKKTRGKPLFEKKVQAIENLKKAGIMTTLVPTVVRGLNDHEVGKIVKFAIDNLDAITAISFQPVSITGRIDEGQRLKMRYTMADLARDIQEQTDSILNMYEDWYPYSIVDPVSRLIEALTKEKKIRFNCHPHCGVATYLVIDRITKKAVPITRFVDIEKAMKDLNKEAETLEKHPWLKGFTKFQIMRKIKKHFKEDKAPEGINFDTFLDFINNFIEADPRKVKKKGKVYHVMGDRYDTMLIAAMHFQDKYNYELDRVRHCVIHYASPDGRLYPFCTWNSGPCHRYKIEEMFSKPYKKGN